MTTVAAVLVTHDSQRWIEQTLASVITQTHQPETIVIVDDHSADNTLAIIEAMLGDRAIVLPSESTASDRITRIAANFQQGVRACRDQDVVVLGDHDDTWLPNRIEHQVALLEEFPAVSLLASDGRLVDADGQPIDGTLRTAFPIPAGFNDLDAAERMRVVLRHSVATGGACALRPRALADLTIPAGWLHDRWWSLVATAQETFRVDEGIVIDYRVTDAQEVGLDRGNQARSGLDRVLAGVTGAGASIRKAIDLQRELAPLATAPTRPEVSIPRLLRNLL